MKVLCISHENFSPHLPEIKHIPCPEIGETVTVIAERTFSDGRDCYLLAEYKSPDPSKIWGYDKRNFSPLTDLDETELVTEEFEEKYCVPVNQ